MGTYTRKKPYSCNQRNKYFSQKGSFVPHENPHTRQNFILVINVINVLAKKLFGNILEPTQERNVILVINVIKVCHTISLVIHMISHTVEK